MRVCHAARVPPAGGARAAVRRTDGPGPPSSAPGGHLRDGARISHGVRAVRRADHIGGRDRAAVPAVWDGGDRRCACRAWGLALVGPGADGVDAPGAWPAMGTARAAGLAPHGHVWVRRQLCDRVAVVHDRAVPGGHRCRPPGRIGGHGRLDLPGLRRRSDPGRGSPRRRRGDGELRPGRPAAAPPTVCQPDQRRAAGAGRALRRLLRRLRDAPARAQGRTPGTRSSPAAGRLQGPLAGWVHQHGVAPWAVALVALVSGALAGAWSRRVRHRPGGARRR